MGVAARDEAGAQPSRGASARSSLTLCRVPEDPMPRRDGVTVVLLEAKELSAMRSELGLVRWARR